MDENFNFWDLEEIGDLMSIDELEELIEEAFGIPEQEEEEEHDYDIKELPSKIISNIILISDLSVKEILKLRTVCRKWNQVVLETVLPKKCVRVNAKYLLEAGMKDFMQHFQNENIITTMSQDILTNKELSKCAWLVEHLRELHLQNIPADKMRGNINKYVHVKYLHMTGCSGARLFTLHELEKLVINDSKIKRLEARSPHLVILNNCKYLKNIKMSMHKNMFVYMKNCNNVFSFDVFNGIHTLIITSIYVKNLWKLSNIKNIQHLIIIHESDALFLVDYTHFKHISQISLVGSRVRFINPGRLALFHSVQKTPQTHIQNILIPKFQEQRFIHTYKSIIGSPITALLSMKI